MRNDKSIPMVYFAPKWIFQALSRTGKSLEQLTLASAVKNCASTKEIAELVAMNRMVYINGCRISNELFFNGTTDDGEDLNVLVSPLVNEQQIKDAVRASLMMTPGSIIGDADVFYELVQTQNSLVIVVEPGFLDQVQNADFSKTFLRNLVMTLGETLSVDKLASYSFYGSYLRTLRA